MHTWNTCAHGRTWIRIHKCTCILSMFDKDDGDYQHEECTYVLYKYGKKLDHDIDIET